MIWAMTQHYADFDVQVRAVLGADGAARHPAELAGATIAQIFFEGLKPTLVDKIRHLVPEIASEMP